MEHEKSDEDTLRLVCGLKDKDTRLICAMGLCLSGNAKFIPDVVGIMDKIIWDEVEDLSLSLPGFGKTVVPFLIPVTRSSKKATAACAMRALGRIGGEEASEALIERLITLPTKSEPTEALIMMGAEAVPFLLPLIRHNKADVRAMAVFALGKIGDISVLQALDVLAETDRSEKVQGVAYRAASWLRGEESCDVDLRSSFGQIPD